MLNQGFHEIAGAHGYGLTAIGDLRQPVFISNKSSVDPHKAASVIGENDASMDPADVLQRKQELEAVGDHAGESSLPPESIVAKRKGPYPPACGRNDEGGAVAKTLAEQAIGGPRNSHMRSRKTFGDKHSVFYGNVLVG